MRTLSALPLLIAGLLAIPAAAQADTANVGMTTFVSTSPHAAQIGQNTPVFQGATAGTDVLAAPTTGTITSWSFLSAGVAPGKTFALRVLRPTGATFTAVATSGPAAVSSPEDSDVAQGPFATSLPVQAGDRIALQAINGDEVPIENTSAPGDGIRYFLSPFADGADAPLAPGAELNNGQVVPVQATITPADAPAPAPIAPENQVPPTISGTPAAGQKLTCDPGSWGGTAPIRYQIDWSQSTLHRVRYVNHKYLTVLRITKHLPGDTTMTVPDLEPDTSRITCTVTATNAVGTKAAASAPVTVVATKPAVFARHDALLHFFLQPPVITLDPAAGSTAQCSTGIWDHFPTRFVFAWFAGHKSPATKPQAGKRIVSRHSSYRLRAIDAKRWLTCRVIAYNAAGHTIAFSTQVKGHA